MLTLFALAVMMGAGLWEGALAPFNAVSGALLRKWGLSPDIGVVLFAIGAVQILAMESGGFSYVEQGRTILGALTVQENLTVAADDPALVEQALSLFPELVERGSLLAHNLSGGEQQMLVPARSLVRRPGILMIDEMSLGLAPVIVKRPLPVVQNAARQGIAVLLVEQFANLALQIGHHADVMTVGEIVLQGACKDLLKRGEEVRQAYIMGNRERSARAPAA